MVEVAVAEVAASHSTWQPAPHPKAVAKVAAAAAAVMEAYQTATVVMVGAVHTAVAAAAAAARLYLDRKSTRLNSSHLA